MNETAPNNEQQERGPAAFLKKYGILGGYEAALLVTLALGGGGKYAELQRELGNKDQAPGINLQQTGRFKREVEDRLKRNDGADQMNEAADVRKKIDTIGSDFDLTPQGVAALVDLAGKRMWSENAVNKFATPETIKALGDAIQQASDAELGDIKLHFGVKKESEA